MAALCMYGKLFGASMIGWLLFESGLAIAAAPPSPGLWELQKVTGSDTIVIDRFGIAACVDGDIAAIGAGNHNHGGLRGGAVYVYRRQEINWVEEAELLPSFEFPAGDNFGDDLDISGTKIMVAASGTDFQGGAYISTFNGTNWVEEAFLQPPTTGTGFGSSVAIAGDLAFVGAKLAMGSQGEGYVYVFDGTNWNLDTVLQHSDAAIVDNFGNASAIYRDGSVDYIVVGARLKDAPLFDSGSVYVFERVVGNPTWTQTAKITPLDPAASAFFGTTVDVDGDALAVGVPGDDTQGAQAGAVYIFRRDAGAPAVWLQEAKLLAGDGFSLDGFGTSIVLSGDRLAVGALDAGVAGKAYLFEYDGTSWNEILSVSPSDGEEGDWFGTSVGFDGDTLVVGARNDDDAGFNAGAAYFFGGLPPAIPALSTWGVMTLAVVLLGAGALLFRRRLQHE